MNVIYYYVTSVFRIMSTMYTKSSGFPRCCNDIICVKFWIIPIVTHGCFLSLIFMFQIGSQNTVTNFPSHVTLIITPRINKSIHDELNYFLHSFRNWCSTITVKVSVKNILYWYHFFLPPSGFIAIIQRLRFPGFAWSEHTRKRFNETRDSRECFDVPR